MPAEAPREGDRQHQPGLETEIAKRRQERCLLAILLLVFSIQFLTTGVLSEMLARVFYQHREGPALLNDTRAGDDDWQRQPKPRQARPAGRRSGAGRGSRGRPGRSPRRVIAALLSDAGRAGSLGR